MALITRVTRLFQADAHAVLDRIEEPIVLLRQAVREMEEDLAQDERQLKLYVHETRQLEKRAQEIEKSLQQLESELDVCFEHDKDDLARTLIRRKLEARRLQTMLSRKRESLQQTLSALRVRIGENRTSMESMRQKADLLSEEGIPVGGDEVSPTSGYQVSDDDVEVAFLREKKSRKTS